VRRLRPYVSRPGPRRQPPPGLHGDWISPAEAALQLGISERTVRYRCQHAQLRCVNWLTGWMVDRASVVDSIDAVRD
jgi:hypothetical protein